MKLSIETSTQSLAQWEREDSCISFTSCYCQETRILRQLLMRNLEIKTGGKWIQGIQQDLKAVGFRIGVQTTRVKFTILLRAHKFIIEMTYREAVEINYDWNDWKGIRWIAETKQYNLEGKKKIVSWHCCFLVILWAIQLYWTDYCVVQLVLLWKEQFFEMEIYFICILLSYL